MRAHPDALMPPALTQGAARGVVQAAGDMRWLLGASLLHWPPCDFEYTAILLAM